MSIIKHVTLQKIVAHDFRYDPRISVTRWTKSKRRSSYLYQKKLAFFISIGVDRRVFKWVLQFILSLQHLRNRNMRAGGRYFSCVKVRTVNVACT